MAKRKETAYVMLMGQPGEYGPWKLEVVGATSGYTPEQARRRAVRDLPQIGERAKRGGEVLLFAVPQKSFTGVPVNVTEVDHVTLGG